MKFIVHLLFISSFFFLNAQDGIKVEMIKSMPLDADTFVGVNMFDELFYVKNDVLFKKTQEELYSYQNRLLGNLSSVNVLNSLETTTFYKDFNTVVKLDKKLGEISKIDFNTSNTFSTITHVASASNKRLWVYNADTQQVHVYNPQQDIIEATTQPIDETIVSFYSNYNFCWLLTKTKLLQYNIYGNLLNSYVLHEFEDVVYYKDNFILKKHKQLYSLPVDAKTPKIIELAEITVKDFSVVNETLYIYDGKQLTSFLINLKNE